MTFEQKLKAILSADKSQAELWEAMSWDQRRKVMQDIGLDDYAYDEALLQDGRYHELLGGMSDLYHDDFLARINGKTIKSKKNGRKFNYDMKSEKKKEDIKYIWYGLPYNLKLHAVKAFNILPAGEEENMRNITYDSLESKAAIAGTMSEFIDFILNHRQYSKSEKAIDADELGWVWDSLVLQGKAYSELKLAGYDNDEATALFDGGDSWEHISNAAYNIDPISERTLETNLSLRMRKNKGALHDFWESQNMQMRQDLFLAAGFPPYDKRFTWPWSAIYDKFTYDEYQEIWHTVENYRMNLARYHGKSRRKSEDDESFAKGEASPYSINNLERTWGLMPMTNRKYALPPAAQDSIDVSGSYWDVMMALEENNFDTDYMETSVMFQVGRFEPYPPLDYEKTKIDKYLEHKWEEMPRNLKEQMLAKYILQPDVYADADLYFLQNQMNGHKYYEFEDELFMKGNDRIYAALIAKAWNKKSPSDRRKALEYAGAGMDIVGESISKEYADLPRRAVETIKSFKPDRQWLQLTAEEQDIVMNSMGLTEEQAAQVRAWDPDTWEKFPFSSNSDYYQGMDIVREMRYAAAPIDQFKRGTKLTRLGSTLTNPY